MVWFHGLDTTVKRQRQAMDDLQERSHMLERMELRGFLGNNKNPPWPCSTLDIPAQPSLVPLAGLFK